MNQITSFRLRKETLGRFVFWCSTIAAFLFYSSLAKGNSITDGSGIAVEVNTINASVCLSGNYNVGVGGDYVTLTAAIADLNTNGVCGPVTFFLIDTSYTTSETFPILIEEIQGSSSVNTVTIKPASGKTVLIQGNIGTYSLTSKSLFEIRGADYLIFDGSNTASGTSKDLTISNDGGDCSTIMFKWGATYNTVKNCIVKGAASSGSSSANSSGVIQINDSLGSGQLNHYISILNNDITSSSALPDRGIDVQYVSIASATPQLGLLISGNRIMNFVSYGVWVGYSNADWSVLNNEFFHEPGVLPLGWCQAITENSAPLDPPFQTTNYRIMGNYIHDIRTTSVNAQQAAISTAGDASNTSLIANNVIVFKETNKASYRGIVCTNTITNVYYNVAYNTVYFGGSYTGTGTGTLGISAAFWNMGGSSTIVLKNNILVNVRSGGIAKPLNSLTTIRAANYAIVDQGSSVPLLSDNNDIYTGSAQNSVYGWKGGTGYCDFWDQWNTATGADLNSIHLGATNSQNGFLPTFKDLANSDMHLDADSNCYLEGAGTPVFNITKDMDSLTTNDTRDFISPDIGADEFASTFGPPFVTIKNDTLSTTTVATFYQWYRDTTAIPGATGQFYVTSQSGAYSLKITNFTGCIAYSSIVIYNGITEFANASLIVYPNPADNSIWIKGGEGATGNVSVNICNVIGEAVFNQNLRLFENPMKIDISHFSKGVYFIHANGENIFYNSKFVKN